MPLIKLYPIPSNSNIIVLSSFQVETNVTKCICTLKKYISPNRGDTRSWFGMGGLKVWTLKFWGTELKIRTLFLVNINGYFKEGVSNYSLIVLINLFRIFGIIYYKNTRWYFLQAENEPNILWNMRIRLKHLFRV